MREDRRRLEDILEAISQIEKYATRGRQAIDPDIIWAAVEDALPSFKKQIQALLTTMK